MAVSRRSRCVSWTLVAALFSVSVYLVGFRRAAVTSSVIADGRRYLTLDMSSDKPLRRLGNQLFAYASLLGLATETGSVPVLPDSLPLFRVFEASHVTRIPAKCFGSKVCGLEFPRSIQRKSAAYTYYAELVGEIQRLPANVRLRGYFLSWRYFQLVNATLRSDFRFRSEVIVKARSRLAELVSSYSRQNGTERVVGIHVRRGDFIRYSSYGYVTAEAQYFRKAMKYFQDRYARVLFVVCTDDVTWAKQRLGGDHVVFAEKNSAAVDLAILSLCDDVIMSTGTFGWWAGWLAGGDVVYLKGWARPGSKLDKERGQRDDFMPPNWIGME